MDINERFMSIYRPVRNFDRRFPGLLREAAVPAAYFGIKYAYNRARNYMRSYSNTLHGMALSGAFKSLKNNNMPPIKRKLPPSPTPTPRKRQKMSPRKTVRVVAKRKMKARSQRKRGFTKSYMPYSYGGKFKKTSRRMTFGLKSIEKFGVKEIREHYGTITSGDAVYVGHSTGAPSTLFKQIWRGIIKRWAMKCGINVTDFLVAQSGYVGDTINIGYRETQEPGAVVLVHTLTVTAPTSLESVADYFADHFDNVIHTHNDTQFIYIFNDGVSNTPRTTLQLTNAIVELYAKSEIKIQNRTLSEGGSKSTDLIDVNPLVGKAYSGIGNGTLYTKPTVGIGATPFQGSSVVGLITVPGSAMQSLTEPPSGKEFDNVKKTGKVMMGAGEIKNSVLLSKKKFKLNDLNHMIGTIDPFKSYPKTKFGKFVFYGLEKLMQDEGEYDITLAYELEYTTVCKVTEMIDNLTVQIVNLSSAP